MCPNTSLAALVERETVSRAPPPITHIKQHTCKYVHTSLYTACQMLGIIYLTEIIRLIVKLIQLKITVFYFTTF